MPDTNLKSKPPVVMIACGGTGGHLFPGRAVAEALRARGCDVTLMISPKDVDQKAVADVKGMGIVTIPAVGFSKGGLISFASGFLKSFRLARHLYKNKRPDVVLAMGGFVSAPPVYAARGFGAKTFLHESNSVPGRANRWLAPWVDGAFVYFADAGKRLRARRVEVSGMPVRPRFLQPMAASEARVALGLNPDAPLLLVMGGSQGATKVNELAVAAAAPLRKIIPDLQFMHLTGERDVERIRAAYASQNAPALVHAFFDDMGLALAAADVAISRAGASSLAEMAARQLPAVLIPYPTAADNHQYFNALAFVKSGAARMLAQSTATTETLTAEIIALIQPGPSRAETQQALAAWHVPGAAAHIAERILHWNKSEALSQAVNGPKRMPVLTY